jgi:hypothetical protein
MPAFAPGDRLFDGTTAAPTGDDVLVRSLLLVMEELPVTVLLGKDAVSVDNVVVAKSGAPV